MIPFSVYALIAIVLAFVGGFFLGKRTEKKNLQNAPHFADSDFMKDLGEKGRKAQQERIERRKARIMERARRKGKITNDDVEDLFCISDSTARNYLNDLEHSGLLTQQGTSGRSVHYTPTN
jgi:predicted HTH transcriptional regulator